LPSSWLIDTNSNPSPWGGDFMHIAIFLVNTKFQSFSLRWLFYAYILLSSWSMLIPILLPEVVILCILPSSWLIDTNSNTLRWLFYAYCYLLGQY
jgi:hypothetical protein